jgi:hypothetical protein
LDCGFIQDELNNGVPQISQNSIQDNRLENNDKCKIKANTNFNIINNEEKLQKINSKLENIKNSYNNINSLDNNTKLVQKNTMYDRIS